MNNIKTIYCDFDGTITKSDTVNSFLEKFTGDKWLKSEKLWLSGGISSKENARIQVALLPNIKEKTLNEFINNIEIDNYFLEFLEFTKSKNIKVVILSDGFDLFIEKVLQKYNIDNIEYYANHLIYEDEKFRIEFPNNNKNCEISAGMCKCSKIKEKDFCYIGDGNSDLCVAQKAKTLFATKKLQKYCENNSISYFPFNTFMDIIEQLKNV